MKLSDEDLNLARPLDESVTIDEIKNYQIVFFDIETTGLRESDQIVQVIILHYYNVFNFLIIFM